MGLKSLEIFNCKHSMFGVQIVLSTAQLCRKQAKSKISELLS